MIEYAKDIILNSNLSLRRNLKDFDFPTTMTYEDSEKVLEKVKEIYPDEVILLSEIDENTLNKLINDMVLSEDCDSNLAQIAVVIKDDYILTINDRDHIAINIRNFDMDIKKAYKRAYEIEAYLDEAIDFAFMAEYGYLTSDARNAGSGLEIRLKMFLFGLVSAEESYYGFKQGLMSHGMYAERYVPQYYDRYADDIYMVKNFGNYKQDMDGYIDKLATNIDSLVRNERRFRRDYQVLNNVSDEDILEEVAISLSILNSEQLKSLNTIARELYKLKKYNKLGFNTDLTSNELDYLIFNLNKNKYKGKKDPERIEFLNSYMKERQWKLTD
ncbi:ATP--guanido phosphotransferase [uncultured Anaerococcus sp.]|uniref:ATP--guanido phosphotransferase n=1 Tax=uncultured Anaerococcus sp. TaxID=293428 RepID=UPI0026058C96|nr:ATP--guanido phosphotransferase [uncultured Anaerococcus sp.]